MKELPSKLCQVNSLNIPKADPNGATGPEREDEAEADRIYHLIKSQIQEIDRILESTSTSSDVVQ